jgi:hypothetical protein
MMKAFLLGSALFLGQMNTMQEKPAVHLQPHSHAIPKEFGGKLVELIHAPAVVNLPPVPPQVDSQGNPWEIEVRNLGPDAVMVVGEHSFSVPIPVGRTLAIQTSGRGYSLKH